MGRHKRGLLRNIGIASMSMLFLLTCLALLPLSSASAHEETVQSIALGTPTVQAAPTEDATVTALNKEKLVHENDWWWNYGATILTSIISTLTLAAAGVFTVVRYFNDRRDTREQQEAEAKRLAEDRKAERERRDEEQQRWLDDQDADRKKRAEERFQAVIEGLSSQREEAKIGAAILLRTFLRPGYEQFYVQVFDLAVANLRPQRTSHQNPDTSVPLTTLRQALIVVFKEAFPLARSQNEENSQFLDASRIQLDNAHFGAADLKQAQMRQASLRNVTLFSTTLSGAVLFETNLSGASLQSCDLSKTRCAAANLREACLFRVNLSRADLLRANLSGADLRGANLSKAFCHKADLSRANLSKAHSHMGNLSEANMSKDNPRRADLSGADLSEADLSEADLSETNIEDALSLKGTDLRGVKGLTKEQVATCKAKGAIIDNLTSSPQNNDAYASSTPPAQETTLPSDPEKKIIPSSQQEP